MLARWLMSLAALDQLPLTYKLFLEPAEDGESANEAGHSGPSHEL